MVALAVAGCATPGPTAQEPSDAPSATVGSPTAAASPAPTSAVEPGLTGDLPAPNATVPPGQPVIDDLKLDDLTGIWASLGLMCVSRASGGPESPAAYNVHCEGGDQSENVEVVAEADLWTLDGVVAMSVSVTPIDGSIDGVAAADRWVAPFAELAGGDPSVEWIHSKIGDPACNLGCTEAARAADLSYYSGNGGGQQLFLVVPT